MKGRVAALLGRVAFKPATLPDGLILSLALLPPAVAGIAIYHLRALQFLAVALAIGAIAHAAARLASSPVALTPVVPAVVGVLLVGPGASPAWAAGVAALAAGLELGRARLLPAARVQTGLIAYAALFLAGRSALANYIDARTLLPFPDPITLWRLFGGGAAAPLDPVRLYVGNVAGPALATSLLAAVIALAWLWYARRLSLTLMAAFAAGAALIPVTLNWNVLFHLDSGPLWLVAGLALAERRQLPPPAVRPFLGFAAGMLAIVPRSRGYGLEAGLVLLAALQLLLGAVEVAEWALRQRRRPAADTGRASGRARPAVKRGGTGQEAAQAK